MTVIQRDLPIPLYHQLREHLAERILSEWRPGDMLPTEEQLQEQYEISRTTVRQALKELEIDGLISRQPGRGTFVSRPKLSHSAEPRFGLTDTLRERGMQPSWQLIDAAWETPPAEVAAGLNLGRDIPVFRLRRLRLASDEAIGYHVAYVSPVVATAISNEHLETGGSLDYLRMGEAEVLEGSYADRVLEAVPATEEVALRLDVDVGTPMFLIRRKLFSRHGQAIELLQAIYRGDRLQYHVRRASAS